MHAMKVLLCALFSILILRKLPQSNRDRCLKNLAHVSFPSGARSKHVSSIADIFFEITCSKEANSDVGCGKREVGAKGMV